SANAGKTHIWRMDIDGGNPKQLISDDGNDGTPSFSPDGRWILFSSAHGDRLELFEVPIDGGESVRLSQGYLADDPNLSPDGKLLAASYREKAGAPLKLIILAPDGGQPQKILDVPETTISSFRWLPDSRSYAFVDEQKGVSNIWTQQIDGGKPRQLTDFTSG